MSQRTVITGGRLVTDTDEIRADLVIDDDQVVAMLADAEGVDADEQIDARDLLILPGGIDAHYVAPWLQDGAQADTALADQRAAAAGGVTTLIADAGRSIDADAAQAQLGTAPTLPAGSRSAAARCPRSSGLRGSRRPAWPGSPPASARPGRRRRRSAMPTCWR
jgi:imidazolonepropionase-like amidohydrolase